MGQRKPFCTATERVYAQLKMAIINFHVRPNEKLTEAQLSAQFKVSRTPAREALQRLAREGLVRPVAREGYFVRAFDLDEVDKDYEVRIALEVLSVELAAPMIRPEALEALEAYWCHPPAEFAEIDPDRFVRRDENFHETIAAQSGNPLLTQFLQKINERIRIIRRLDYTEPALIRRSFGDHAAVLTEIAARNPVGAVARMREHIDASRVRTRALATERLARIFR